MPSAVQVAVVPEPILLILGYIWHAVLSLEYAVGELGGDRIIKYLAGVFMVQSIVDKIIIALTSVHRVETGTNGHAHLVERGRHFLQAGADTTGHAHSSLAEGTVSKPQDVTEVDEGKMHQNDSPDEKKRTFQGPVVGEDEDSESETQCTHIVTDRLGSNGSRWRITCRACEKFWSGPWCRCGPQRVPCRAYGPCLP